MEQIVFNSAGKAWGTITKQFPHGRKPDLGCGFPKGPQANSSHITPPRRKAERPQSTWLMHTAPFELSMGFRAFSAGSNSVFICMDEGGKGFECKKMVAQLSTSKQVLVEQDSW